MKITQTKIDKLWSSVIEKADAGKVENPHGFFEKKIKSINGHVYSFSERKEGKQAVQQAIIEATKNDKNIFTNPSTEDDGGTISFISVPKYVVSDRELHEKIIEILNSDESVNMKQIISLANGDKKKAIQAYNVAAAKWEEENE